MADLPVKPSLDHLRRQARDLLRAARAGDTTAAGRIRAPSTTSPRSPSSSCMTTCGPNSTARSTWYSPASQATVAPGAARRLVPDDAVRMTGQLHRRARLPLRPARLPAGLLPQRLRRRLTQPVRRRRLRGIRRILPHPGRKLGDLLPQVRHQPLGLRYPRPQRRDLGVPPGQQLPQPRVRRPQPGSITRRTRRIEHMCSSPQPALSDQCDTPSWPASPQETS